MMELTVPWEKHMEGAHEGKVAKYQSLVEDGKDQGWQRWCFLWREDVGGSPDSPT